MHFAKIVLIICCSYALYSCQSSGCGEPNEDCDRSRYISYSIDSAQQKNYIFDSIQMIYPKLIKLGRDGRIPISYEVNEVTILLHKWGKSDTLTIGYRLNYDYSERCESDKLVVDQKKIVSTSLSGKFKVYVYCSF